MPSNEPVRENPYQRRERLRREKAHAEGRTYWTARCNCYRGSYTCGNHSPNSGRCYARDLYTTPERQGVCDYCAANCGWDA